MKVELTGHDGDARVYRVSGESGGAAVALAHDSAAGVIVTVRSRRGLNLTAVVEAVHQHEERNENAGTPAEGAPRQ